MNVIGDGGVSADKFTRVVDNPVDFSSDKITAKRKKTYQSERYNVRCIENGKIDLKFLIFSLFLNSKIGPKPN